MRLLLRLLLVLLAGTCILAARWAERRQSSPANQLAPAHRPASADAPASATSKPSGGIGGGRGEAFLR